MRILRHLTIPIPDSPYFTIMGAISASVVRWSEAQLQLKRPQVGITDLVASIGPSSSTPSTSTAGGVTLEAIMAQLQRMDARLDSLTDEMC